MLINFHLTSKESRAQSNLFSNSISAALFYAYQYVLCFSAHFMLIRPTTKIGPSCWPTLRIWMLHHQHTDTEKLPLRWALVTCIPLENVLKYFPCPEPVCVLRPSYSLCRLRFLQLSIQSGGSLQTRTSGMETLQGPCCLLVWLQGTMAVRLSPSQFSAPPLDLGICVLLLWQILVGRRSVQECQIRGHGWPCRRLLPDQQTQRMRERCVFLQDEHCCFEDKESIVTS